MSSVLTKRIFQLKEQNPVYADHRKVVTSHTFNSFKGQQNDVNLQDYKLSHDYLDQYSEYSWSNRSKEDKSTDGFITKVAKNQYHTSSLQQTSPHTIPSHGDSTVEKVLQTLPEELKSTGAIHAQQRSNEDIILSDGVVNPMELYKAFEKIDKTKTKSKKEIKSKSDNIVPISVAKR